MFLIVDIVISAVETVVPPDAIESTNLEKDYEIIEIKEFPDMDLENGVDQKVFILLVFC